MLILFFDTYIVKGVGEKGGLWGSEALLDGLPYYRDRIQSYRWRDKIEIVKYTLTSYSTIPWDKVIIRFECEDTDSAPGFFKFCVDLFPTGDIQTQRSNTAKKYLDALSNIDADETAWIFFSPNNDHPYLAHPSELIRYTKHATDISDRYPDNTVSLIFSHYTESMISNRPTDPRWAFFGGIYKSVIEDAEEYLTVTSNRASLDSCQLFKLGYLKSIFKATKNQGRVIRLEDLEFNGSAEHNLIQVLPKRELCRHFDGYGGLLHYVPPLFIPEGFFSGEIKIRYGFYDYLPGWVNINPLKSRVSDNVDLLNVIDDLPHFWLSRISQTVVATGFPMMLDKRHLVYYRNLRNPFWRWPRVINLIRSFYRFVIVSALKRARRLVRSLLVFSGVFPYARKLKRAILPGWF